MIRIVLVFLISVTVFGQTESSISEKRISDETPMSMTTSLVGYNFWDGGFMSARLSKTSQFHFGIVHTYVKDYKVLEVPLIIKKRLNTDFHAFFGGRMNSTVNADFGSQELSPYSGPTLGASYELGLQYDVNKNLMLEMRYSLPADKNKKVYPYLMDYNNKGMFRLSSGFKF